jgi:hypothetical protein
MSRLAHTDRARGVVVRYQRERPGELVHLDVKKLGRIPDGVATASMAGPRQLGAEALATTIGCPQPASIPATPWSGPQRLGAGCSPACYADPSPTRCGRDRQPGWPACRPSGH